LSIYQKLYHDLFDYQLTNDSCIGVIELVIITDFDSLKWQE